MSDDALRTCYEKVAAAVGGDVDPIECVLAVERHRRYWRPAKPKVILLAESHVLTDTEDLRPMRGCSLPSFHGIPDTYVRFVYCLGYGEDRFVGAPVAKNRGTPQFWKILWACLHRVNAESDFSDLLASRTEFESRIETKRGLLESLRDRGVWLVDASVLALYRPGGAKPSREQRTEAIRLSWDHYVRGVWCEASPRFTIVIGKEVERALADRLGAVTGGRHEAVPQPQARLRGPERLDLHQKYSRLCAEHGV